MDTKQQFNPSKVDEELFKLSQSNTTIETRISTKFRHGNDRYNRRFRYAMSDDRIDPINNPNHRLHYWEIKLVQGFDITLGVSSSNIKVKRDRKDVVYFRTPIICSWNFLFQQLSGPSLPGPRDAPVVKAGDRVGFLIDFLTPEHNGCIRIFYNGIEIGRPEKRPFTKNLRNSDCIYEKIPPFSLLACAHPPSFKVNARNLSYNPKLVSIVSIVQNPVLPLNFCNLLIKYTWNNTFHSICSDVDIDQQISRSVKYRRELTFESFICLRGLIFFRPCIRNTEEIMFHRSMNDSIVNENMNIANKIRNQVLLPFGACRS